MTAETICYGPVGYFLYHGFQIFVYPWCLVHDSCNQMLWRSAAYLDNTRVFWLSFLSWIVDITSEQPKSISLVTGVLFGYVWMFSS